MCFSATASFTTATFLLISSFLTLTKATTKQRMFAAIPLLFSLQQFCEGMIWHRLEHHQNPLWYPTAFIIFVFVIWPLWIPLSVKLMSRSKREHFFLPILAGAIVALIGLSYIGSTPVHTAIMKNHIAYTGDVDLSLTPIITVLYLFATIAPFFIIKIRYAPLMGSVLALSYLFTASFYSCHIISVWCFFAAVLSGIILAIVGK